MALQALCSLHPPELWSGQRLPRADLEEGSQLDTSDGNEIR